MNIRQNASMVGCSFCRLADQKAKQLTSGSVVAAVLNVSKLIMFILWRTLTPNTKPDAYL
jgi:hypothetical protein